MGRGLVVVGLITRARLCVLGGGTPLHITRHSRQLHVTYPVVFHGCVQALNQQLNQLAKDNLRYVAAAKEAQQQVGAAWGGGRTDFFARGGGDLSASGGGEG